LVEDKNKNILKTENNFCPDSNTYHYFHFKIEPPFVGK
jgi:hypothetical protein